MARLRRLAVWTGSLVLLAGLVPLVWLQGKAWLAQGLIAASWMLGGTLPPWPWADTRPVAVLEIPRLQRRLFVLDGLSGRTLAFGPGYYRDPDSGDIVLAGHRDSHFAGLQRLRVGDALFLHHGGRQDRWQVVAVMDLEQPRLRLAGDGSLWLSTCLPHRGRGPTPRRRVVQAKRVGVTEAG